MDRATVPGFIPDFNEIPKNGIPFKGKIVKCVGCGKEVYRRMSLIKRSKVFACSKSCASRFKMLGKTPWNKGKGEPRSLPAQIRESKEYKKWRDFIFRRDHYTCKICGDTGGKVEADHYPKQFAKIFHNNHITSMKEAIDCDEFWDTSNGRTLCKKCHKKHGRMNYRKGKCSITIFGGSGFLGTALIERLLSTRKGVEITAVARNESSLVLLKEKFPSVLTMVGDIADSWAVKKAMVDADEVYLLSAQKHVGLSEKNVNACIMTNIAGTMNVISESLTSRPKILMFISSDKAAQPNGVYGCTKKIGEKLMEEAQEMNPKTKYRVVRYGNVLMSSGSVLCKWKDKIQAGEEIIVTDVESTRFYWPVSDAVDLIFNSINTGKDAKPIVTGMKSMRLGDLLEAMFEKYGRVPVKTIGLQPGENMHEVIAEGIPDSFHSERFTKEEILQFI